MMVHKRTFFEIMRAPNAQERAHDLESSLRWHLIHLLNTRQGTLQHLPDYGLPDLIENTPQGLNTATFLESLSKTVLQYEPRIATLLLQEQKHPLLETVLRLKMHAQTAWGPLSWTTSIRVSGQVHLEYG